MARTKTVYPTREITHLWAHQTQTTARNPQGNLYFYGPTIYSYRDSFPIGMHVTNDRNEKAVLITTDTYSNTTAHHVSQVRQSTSHMEVFHVLLPHYGSFVKDCQEGELDRYAKQIPELLLKAKRARSSHMKEWTLGRAIRLRQEALAFANFFDLDASKLPTLDYDVTAMEASLRAAQKREREVKKAREAQKLIELKDHITAWRQMGTVPYYMLYSVPTMLRVIGDRVETSRGAAFPLEHARNGLALVRRVMAHGQDWKANGHSFHLGNYKIDRITKDGTVYAGCHVVEWAEIERIAPELDVDAAAVDRLRQTMKDLALESIRSEPTFTQK